MRKYASPFKLFRNGTAKTSALVLKNYLVPDWKKSITFFSYTEFIDSHKNYWHVTEILYESQRTQINNIYQGKVPGVFLNGENGQHSDIFILQTLGKYVSFCLIP